MWYEDPHIVALGITLAASVSVCAFLNRYLIGILRQYAGNSTRGRFWAAMAQVILVMVPASVVLVSGQVGEGDSQGSLRILLQLTGRGLIGLSVTVILLSVLIGTFGQTHGSTVFVDAEESAELTRLLLKIRELRARELISRIDAGYERKYESMDEFESLTRYPVDDSPDNR